VSSCEHCNEILGSIKGDEFIDQLNDYRLHNGVARNTVLHMVTEMEFQTLCKFPYTHYLYAIEMYVKLCA
jgi:hypothetical protein